MADGIVILLVVLVVGAAVKFIIKEKKRGVKCIGCSSAGTCGKKSCCSCSVENDMK